MSDDLERQLAALRREFDDSFARAHVGSGESQLAVLLVRAGERECALAVDDMALLGRCPAIAPVPSAQAALLGLAASRGAIVAVYGLAALLGHEGDAPGWMVLLRGDRSVAIAFDGFDGQCRVDARALLAPPDGAPPYVAGFVPVGGRDRLLISAERLSSHLTVQDDDRETSP